jgi:hypothetical protein
MLLELTAGLLSSKTHLVGKRPEQVFVKKLLTPKLERLFLKRKTNA